MAAHLQGAVSGTSRPQQIHSTDFHSLARSLSSTHTPSFSLLCFMFLVFTPHVSRWAYHTHRWTLLHCVPFIITSTMSRTLCPPEPPHTTSRLASASRCTHANTQTHTHLLSQTHTDTHTLSPSPHSHPPSHPGQVKTHLKQMYIGATC